MGVAENIQLMIGDLSERMQLEYRRSLIRSWPMKAATVGELKIASLEAVKDLEENARKFIAEATGQVPASSRTLRSFALIHESLARHVSALEGMVLEKWQLAALGLGSSDELNADFERALARLDSRLEVSRFEFTAGTNPSPSNETRGRKTKHQWVKATDVLP
jgi:hypothetical protein